LRKGSGVSRHPIVCSRPDAALEGGTSTDVKKNAILCKRAKAWLIAGKWFEVSLRCGQKDPPRLQKTKKPERETTSNRQETGLKRNVTNSPRNRTKLGGVAGSVGPQRCFGVHATEEER